MPVEKIGSVSVAVLSHVASGLGRSMLQILSAFDANIRVAKCHEYDGYIRVKIFRGWGKKSERTHNMAKRGLF